jgi:hypothetical protein
MMVSMLLLNAEKSSVVCFYLIPIMANSSRRLFSIPRKEGYLDPKVSTIHHKHKNTFNNITHG